MEDVNTICEVYAGRRYKENGLKIKYQNKSITDVLDMAIDDTAQLFYTLKLLNIIQRLIEVGVDYLPHISHWGVSLITS